jgi:hypothetical protein
VLVGTGVAVFVLVGSAVGVTVAAHR